jgi:hypothetical protein
MSGHEDEQADWVERFTGVKVANLRRRDNKVQAALDEIGVQADVRQRLGHAQAAQDLRDERDRLADDRDEARDADTGKAALRELAVVKQEARGVVPAAVDKAARDGLRRAIAKLLDNIDHQIGQSDDGRAKTRLEDRQKALRQKFTAVDDKTSKSNLESLQGSALSLLDDALKAGYSDKYRRVMIPNERDRAYKDMLESRYGFKVETPLVDLKRFYAAMDLIPMEHVNQTSLKSIKVSDAGGALGDYDGSAKRIRIDVAKVKERPKIEYQVDGSKKTLDTFNVATVHEVGHAVDDKAGIMANPGHQSYGGWGVDIGLDAVADAYWAELEKTIGATYKAAVLAELKSALEGKPAKRPTGLPDDAWKLVGKAFAACQEVRKDATPWKTPRPVGDTVYHFTYNKWYSYSKQARDAVTVRDYQWRAPGEWFAELYAASWITKKKPAAAVNADAAKFMYRDAK